MRILLDTNIITRIIQPTHRDHNAARNAVRSIIARKDEPCLVPQNIYEFWALGTRPRSERNGLGLSPPQMESEIASLERNFTFLRGERGIYPEWIRLVVRYNVMGLPSHDARFVAAMVRRGITHILTFDVHDFLRYDGIVVLDPHKDFSLA